MNTEYTRLRSYIKPDVLEEFLTWLSDHLGYKVEIKTIGSEKFAYVNGVWSARMGPFKTFDQRVRPHKSIPETARLSRDLFKEYDQWQKNSYSV